MKQTSVFRVTGDICFYFAVLNVFGAFRVWRVPMALFAVLCLLLGFAAVRSKNAAVRLTLALVPGFSFLIGPFQWLLVFPAIAWLYYVLVMARGNYAMPLYEYRKSFTAMLVICLFFLAANIANAVIYWNQVISADSLVYAFAFLVLGVIAMRRMEMGAEMSLRWRLRNALSVIGVPILAVGASVLLFLLLRFSQGALRLILEPVGRFILWLIHKLFPNGHSPIEEMTLEEYLRPKNPVQALELETDIMTGDKFEFQGTDYSRMLIERAAGIGAWVVLGLLLVLALVLVVRYARRNQPADENEMEIDETQAVSAPDRRRKKKAALPIGNARQLRRVYKTYLEYRRARGLSVGPSDTSEEILEREKRLGIHEDANRLRELYIAARYGNPSAVTRDQVLEAQACLERITEQKSMEKR